MADIDYSIASKVQVPQFDPLGVASKAIGLGQGVLNNKLLGQQVNSKIALGRAVTGATDPQTGQTDWNKALGSLSQDPQGSFAVPELAAAVLARKKAEIENNSAALKLSADRWAKIGDTTTSLLASKDQLTPQMVTQTLTDDLLHSGLLNGADGKPDPQAVGQFTSVIQRLPQDDAGIRKMLQNLSVQSNTTTERINQILGPVTPVDQGGQIALTQTPPLGGPTTVRANIEKSLTPGEASTPTPVLAPGPGGTMVPADVTRGQFASMATNGPVQTAPALSPHGLTPDVATAPVQAFQGDKPVLTTREAVAGAGAPVQTGPALGQPETAHSNVDQAQTLQRRASIVPQRRAALSEMVSTLDNFTPGPKANLTGTINGLAAQFGIPVAGATEGRAAQDTFNKLAAQIALDQWGSLGGTGSNEQLATAVHANPNEAMSKLGIKNVAALLQGNEDAIGAQFDAWQKYSATHGPGSYGDFIQGWNRYYDPRVFQAQHMTPGAVKVMLGNMTDAERKKFTSLQSVAKRAGWLGGE